MIEWTPMGYLICFRLNLRSIPQVLNVGGVLTTPPPLPLYAQLTSPCPAGALDTQHATMVAHLRGGSASLFMPCIMNRNVFGFTLHTTALHATSSCAPAHSTSGGASGAIQSYSGSQLIVRAFTAIIIKRTIFQTHTLWSL